jgi:hypothetical protein
MCSHPFQLTDVGLVAGLNANVVGTLSLTADVAVSYRTISDDFQLTYPAQGTIDSGKIQLITLGIPGFDIPGVFSLGPTFTVRRFHTKYSPILLSYIPLLLKVDAQVRSSSAFYRIHY